MGNTLLKMAVPMRENGAKINSMVKELKFAQMATNMKGNGRMISVMA